MLDSVTAVGFSAVFESGRTFPILIDVEKADGAVVQAVAKLSGTECGPGGLVREAFSSMLAADLGLPVPEPFLIDFPSGFSSLVPSDVRERLDRSLSPTFGTLFIHGLSAYSEAMELPSALIDCASMVVAFDGAVRNSDRGGAKPNCLTDNKDKLLIIDHELALIDDPLLGAFFNPYPWQQDGMNALDNSERRHVLLAAARGKGGDLAQLQKNWELLDSKRFEEYKNAIPEVWDPSGDICLPILKYLCEVRDNLPGLFEEAKRILK
ncbi:HipA family kinase [Stenotrophomonas maltophilia]|uniref:HipA family kinase n=1 Tax=Stenotrophomonas maltophilia TaxID=40324 RepID=UPI0039C40037